MSMFRRSMLVGPVVVLAAVLTGCASGQSVDNSPGQQGSQEPQSSEQTESQIENPKDASQLELCGLLSKDAATTLNLNPQGEMRESDVFDESVPASCRWREAGGGSASIDFSLFTDRSIQRYYAEAEGYAEFEKMTIAAHPAAKVNHRPATSDGTCNLAVGTKDGQVVLAQAGSMSDGGDPCGMAKQALEKSIPTWPSAK